VGAPTRSAAGTRRFAAGSRLCTPRLQEAGLGWVVDQVRDQIQRGRTITRKRGTGEIAGIPLGKIPEDVDVTAEPYSPRERLELLVDAAARALEQAPALEEATLRFSLEEDPEAPKAFVFESDEDEPQPRITEFRPRAEDAEERTRVARVAALLRQLKA
jgi:hypothetical protein